MASRLFLDTNVLLYPYDGSEPIKQPEALWLVRQLVSSGQAVVSTQILGEFFWASTRKLRFGLTVDEARVRIEHFIEVFHVHDVTSEVVLEALRGVAQHQLPYWDAQIWATARLHQVPVVLSEDFQDGQQLEGVRFLNPFASEFDLYSILV